MSLRSLTAFLMALHVAACSAPYSPVDPASPADVARIAPKLEGRNRVTLQSGERTELHAVTVAADSIRGTMPGSVERRSFPTLHVTELSHRSRMQGASRGLWIGAAAGVLIAAIASPSQDDSFVDPGPAFFFPVIGGAGAVTGFGFGFALGSWKNVLLIRPGAPADPARSSSPTDR